VRRNYVVASVGRGEDTVDFLINSTVQGSVDFTLTDGGASSYPGLGFHAQHFCVDAAMARIREKLATKLADHDAAPATPRSRDR
jgi:hypothetical protein